jgi:LPXTG-site transpeptidase (sortase) family protein
MKKIRFSKDKIIKMLLILIEITAVLILFYLILFPFYPELKYRFFYDKNNKESINLDEKISTSTLKEAYKSNFPESDFSISPNRIIIKKIGVNAPIIESHNSDYGLSRGAWHVPESSTPEKGSNTVITGHRFKYLPPNNLTFYLFHKLEVNDEVYIIWNKKDYFYKIREIKIVPDTELSILNSSEKSILTMFTCDPIYSTENRLVVIADLID